LIFRTESSKTISGWIHSDVSCASGSSGLSQNKKKMYEGKTKERNEGNMVKRTVKEVKIRKRNEMVKS
jgi:hypothetical protein